MTEPIALDALRAHRLLSVIRAPSPAAAVGAATAIGRGGIPIVEITFTVPDALRVMAELAAHDDLIVGAGTVLTAAQARDALAAGARFVVAPNYTPEVARVALDAGVLYCPGAYTTSEIIAARQGGAHLIKVYPVGVAGGPDYIRIIRDPLPDIPMLAAGGTTLANVVPFLNAGCVGIGLGGSLCDPQLAAAGEHAALEQRARAFVERVTSAGYARSRDSSTPGVAP